MNLDEGSDDELGSCRGQVEETEGEAQQVWGEAKEKADDIGEKAGEMWERAKEKVTGDDPAEGERSGRV